MPRKAVVPIVQMLQFFQTQPIEVAEIGLQLARAEVEKRRLPKAKPVSRQRASVPAASLAPAPIVMPEPKGLPVVSAARPRSRRMRAAPSTQEQDVSLPGMPGPVPVVGG